MSEREIQSLLKAIDQVNKKWFLYKFATAAGMLITFGVTLGGWYEWRKNTDRRIDRIESVVKVAQR